VVKRDTMMEYQEEIKRTYRTRTKQRTPAAASEKLQLCMYVYMCARQTESRQRQTAARCGKKTFHFSISLRAPIAAASTFCARRISCGCEEKER